MYVCNMKGILKLTKENNWIVEYNHKDDSTISSVPLSTFNHIMYKNELYDGANIEFNIIKDKKTISNCYCTEDKYDSCEHFIKAGINDCINFELIDIQCADIFKIEPKPDPTNQKFDRKLVQELLIEVKNRFGVMDPDNYINDFQIIEWFNRNYPTN
jgi:hypothetical protein